MLEWVANALGLASLAPWRPRVSLAISAIGCLLTWLASETPWATVVFGLSIALAVWVWAESFRGAAAGFLASVIGFQILLGVNTSLDTFHPTPYGCVTIDGRDADECINDAVQRARGLPGEP